MAFDRPPEQDTWPPIRRVLVSILFFLWDKQRSDLCLFAFILGDDTFAKFVFNFFGFATREIFESLGSFGD